MPRKTIKQKLLEKVIEHCSWVESDALLLKCNPTPEQREAGASLWMLPDYDIWSTFSMKECLDAEKWYIAEFEHHLEIIPEQ
jgi:hypothetical protein